MNSRDRVPDEQLRDFFTYSKSGVEVEGELQEANFGEYLVDKSVITRQQLFEALQLQDRNPGVRLGECVAALGYLPYKKVEKLVADWQALNVIEL